jgi:hypothetical protein
MLRTNAGTNSQLGLRCMSLYDSRLEIAIKPLTTQVSVLCFFRLQLCCIYPPYLKCSKMQTQHTL